MKRIFVAFEFALLLALAPAIAKQNLHIHAREISHDGPVTNARGEATLSNGAVQVQADSISYNQATGEAQASGNVRIKFLVKPQPSGDGQSGPVLSPQQQMERLQRRPLPPEIWIDR